MSKIIPALACLVIMSSLSLTPLHAAEEFGSDPENTVITPVKMTQSIRDVPAAVTLIDGDTLRRLGVTSIAEALRLAPGMVLGQGNNWDYQAAYHGTNNNNTRRMQVLVDGMSVYRSGLATIEWQMLPVPLKDISRIEVTRDPSSASYGANAFQAVVNIITKPLTPGAASSISTQRNSLGSNQSYLRLESQYQDALFGLSAEHSKSDGFDYRKQTLADQRLQNYIDGWNDGPARDESEHTKLIFKYQQTLNRNNSVQLQFGGVKSREDLNRNDAYAEATQPDIVATDNFINVVFTSDQFASHRIKAALNRYQTHHRQEWRWCYGQVTLLPEFATLYQQDPALADTLSFLNLTPDEALASPFYSLLQTTFGERRKADQASIDLTLQQLRQRFQQLGEQAYQNACGNINQNFVDTKNSLEIQDTWAFTDTLRAVTGIGGSRNITDSETFLGGTVQQDKHWIYTNIEWHASKTISANIGTMLERDDITDTLYNMPRAAIGYDFLPDQTIKFVASASRRTPDLTETNLYFHYRITELSPPVNGAERAYNYRLLTSDPRLSAETDLSKAIIWLGRAPELGLSYEVKVFKEHLNDLISENFNTLTELTNNGEVDMKGAEYQVRFKLTPQFTLLHTYAYLEQSANTPLETQLYARHSGSLALLADAKPYQYAVSLYNTDFKNTDDYQEVDFLVGRHYELKNQALFWQAKLNYYPQNRFSQQNAAVL
ncbi:MAG TPA: TonB-dependent receptor plug domain-containing protein, partial [Pseudomonadales bacterium]|nr:TonB-dependent receptor plug domain-containing protein [Pseudomonadales bacterium]